MSNKKFKREDTHKRKGVPSSWRKPTGRHSRSRLEKKGAAPRPKAGYRNDRRVRGLHPSGYEDVLVHNTQDLEAIDPETQVARIGSTVGKKKRHDILEKADNEDITVLNRGEE